MITPTRVEYNPFRNVQEFVCAYESTEEMKIKFQVVVKNVSNIASDFYLDDAGFEEYTVVQDSKVNAITGRRKVTVELAEGLDRVVCSLFDGNNTEIGKIAAIIESPGSMGRE